MSSFGQALREAAAATTTAGALQPAAGLAHSQITPAPLASTGVRIEPRGVTGRTLVVLAALAAAAGAAGVLLAHARDGAPPHPSNASPTVTPTSGTFAAPSSTAAAASSAEPSASAAPSSGAVSSGAVASAGAANGGAGAEPPKVGGAPSATTAAGPSPAGTTLPPGGAKQGVEEPF
jgi:hypothetical protein